MHSRFVMRLRRPRFRGGRTPVVTPSHSAGRLALLGIGAAALCLPVWAGTTLTETGQRVADLILFGRLATDPTVVGAAGETLAALDLVLVAVAAVGIGLLALLRGGLGLAVTTAVAIGGANVTTQALQVVVDRPNLLGTAAYATGNSFPSGHVAVMASLGLAAILVVPRRIRALTAVAAAAAVAVVGLSTVTAGWHRLADVVGAILIALAWIALPAALLARLRGWMPRRSWSFGLGRRSAALGGWIGAAALAVGGIGLALAVVDPTPLAEALDTLTVAPRTFVAGLAVVVGSSLLATAGLLWGLRGIAFESPG